MQVRRWKHMSGHSRAHNEPRTEAHQISGSQTNNSYRKVAVRFINASHPRDVVSIEAKKRIRSHAAKDVHASRHRHDAQHKQSAIQTNDCDNSSLQKATINRRHSPAAQPGAQIQGEGSAHFHGSLPAPAGVLSSSRKDPFQSFARPVTEREHFLIDHYITVVIPTAHSFCDHGDAESLFLVGMKLHWLPMALSDVGLLCGLLLAACRHLMMSCPGVSDDYLRMALLYKGVCIRSTNEAVIAEGTSASDATIAKALIMSSDEFLCGNLETSRLHADAVIRMVALRGGLRNLGVGGFLRHLVSWCVLHPMFGERTSIVLEE